MKQPETLQNLDRAEANIILLECCGIVSGMFTGTIGAAGGVSAHNLVVGVTGAVIGSATMVASGVFGEVARHNLVQARLQLKHPGIS